MTSGASRVFRFPVFKLALTLGVLAWAIPAVADTTVYGIPEESRVSVFALGVPEFGAKQPGKLGPVDVGQERGFMIAWETREELGTTLMLNRWAWRAYAHSPIGSRTVIHTEDGFVFHDGKQGTEYAIDLRMNTPRGFCWHPSGERLAFFAPASVELPRRRIALLEVAEQTPGEPPSFRVLYDPKKDHEPVWVTWESGGAAALVLELVFEDNRAWSVIKRVPLDGSEPTEVQRVEGRIDAFLPLAGTQPGVLSFGPKEATLIRGESRRAFPFRSRYLEHCEQNPASPDQLVIYSGSGKDGAQSGVRLIDLTKDDGAPLLLYDKADVNTLWFSEKGRYVCWSTYPLPGRPAGPTSQVHVVRVDDPQQRIVLAQHDEAGDPLPITGVRINAAETKVAYTAGSRVFVCDLASGQRVQIADFKTPAVFGRGRHPLAPTFAADPTWSGERVLVSVYEDVGR